MRNVCKFITGGSDESLKTINFVLESDRQTMTSGNAIQSYRAILVTEGKGKMHFDGQSIPFSRGHFIFSFPDEVFTVETAEDTEYMYISFEGGRATALMKRYGISKAFRDFPKCEALIPFWREGLSRATDDSIDIISEATLLYSFSRLTGASGEKESAAARAVSYLEENFDDTELSLASVSDALGYNQKYLSHLFKERIGMGFSEYLRMLRLKHAIFLFDHGIDAVKNVAILSGFSDPLYFSSVFKKEVGVSPREYKESKRGADGEEKP